MDTFTLDPRCWRIGRIFGRNPLIRRADRIEALVTLVALIVSLVVIPVAGVAAMLVYDVRDSRYAQEAHERHTVVATVLETETDGAGSTVVQARWPVTAGERTRPLQLTREAKVGEHMKFGWTRMAIRWLRQHRLGMQWARRMAPHWRYCCLWVSR